jgi:hypothetical protein
VRVAECAEPKDMRISLLCNEAVLRHIWKAK